MTRTRRFIGGISLGYAYQFLVTLAGLWLAPFLLRWLGQQDLGLWFVGTQVVTYLTLLDFGVVALLPRDASLASGRALVKGHEDELPLIVAHTGRLLLWQMPLVAIATFAVWLSMPAAWQALSGPLALVFAVFVTTFPLRIFQATLQGLQDLEFLGKSQICSWGIGTALTVALAYAGWGLYALATGWATTQALSSTVALYRLSRRFPAVLPRHLPRIPRDALRKRLGSGFWVTINQVAVMFALGTDVVIIGKLLGPAAVVPYVCTGKLIMVLANQPQILMQTALPALAQLRGGENHDYLSNVCSALSQAMLMVSGGVVCIVLAVNKGFVDWWVGANLYGGFQLTSLALLSMLVRHWNQTIAIILFSFGFERRLAVTGFLDGVVTVCATILLVWYLGLTVAPLGSVIGVCVVSLPLNMSGVLKTNTTLLPRVIRSLLPWFWRISIATAASAALAKVFVPNSFAALAIVSTGMGTFYLVLMFPLLLRPPLGPYLRPGLAAAGSRFLRMVQVLRNKPA